MVRKVLLTHKVLDGGDLTVSANNFCRRKKIVTECLHSTFLCNRRRWNWEAICNTVHKQEEEEKKTVDRKTEKKSRKSFSLEVSLVFRFLDGWFIDSTESVSRFRFMSSWFRVSCDKLVQSKHFAFLLADFFHVSSNKNARGAIACSGITKIFLLWRFVRTVSILAHALFFSLRFLFLFSPCHVPSCPLRCHFSGPICCFGCLTICGCQDNITQKLVFFPPRWVRFFLFSFDLSSFSWLLRLSRLFL